MQLPRSCLKEEKALVELLGSLHLCCFGLVRAVDSRNSCSVWPFPKIVCPVSPSSIINFEENGTQVLANSAFLMLKGSKYVSSYEIILQETSCSLPRHHVLGEDRAGASR